MAEPGWALRARHTGSRWRVTRDRPNSLRRVRTAALARRSGLAWLALLPIITLAFAPGNLRARRAYHAASAARAALENRLAWAFPDVGAAMSAHVRGWRRQLRTTSLSLRLAGHLVVFTLVLAIALAFSKASSLAGALSLGDVSGTALPRRALNDSIVRPVASSSAQVGTSDLLEPLIRVLRPQTEPAFVEGHQLVEGDTLADLARRYGVSVDSLFWANGLQSGNILAAGQELRVPRISGIPHVIQEGDTLESIGAAYQVAPETIILFKANGVSMGRPLPVGREIFIPGGKAAYPPDMLSYYGGEEGIATIKAVTAGVVEESETNLRTGPGRAYPRVGYLDAGSKLKLIARYEEWIKVEVGANFSGWVRGDLLQLPSGAIDALPETNDFPPPPPLWVWPTRGAITSPFGWRRVPFQSFHDGLDIANAARTRIYAARAGRVFEAGWCSGFGYCVKIDHGDGVTTIYGHMIKKPVVATGDRVDAGDLIGYMGSTYDARGGGFSTGVHLHFTIKVNGKPVNPLKFLP